MKKKNSRRTQKCSSSVGAGSRSRNKYLRLRNTGTYQNLSLVSLVFILLNFFLVFSKILHDVRGRIQIHNTVFVSSMADNKITSAATCILLHGILKNVCDG